MSPLASPSATHELLERYGLTTKHRLGQNFLVDNHVVERIMALAALLPDDHVVEVGPGIGTLTLALLQEAKRVLSIEMDAALEPVLADMAQKHTGFFYLMGDALKVELDAMATALEKAPDMLVANLPYNVAATVILDYFQRYPSLRGAVVMVQKEVADRIGAQAGTKTYGAYTVKLALLGRVTGRFEVSPRCFMPAPHVDSAVVRIDRWSAGEGPLAATFCKPPLSGCVTYDNVASVIDAAFVQRRKTIRNSMVAAGYDKDLLDAAFASCGIAPSLRGEALLPDTFVCLAHTLQAIQQKESDFA